MQMCITQVWTYQECGCRYFYPDPCSDRVVKSPTKSYKTSGNWSSTSAASTSSLASIFSRATIAEAKDSVSTAPSRQNIFELDIETDADYKHRLQLVRTCSLRQTLQKTFLEPICDDCLLLELGLAAQPSSMARSHEHDDHDQGALHGAEWLLESSVEITVEPPADDFVFIQPQSDECSSSDEEFEDETARRGRGRRRALEISRDSLLKGKTALSKSCSSFPRFNQVSQHLRRARKQQDLKSPSASGNSLSESSSTKSSTTSSGWIEHLESDLRQRGRKRQLDIVSEISSSSPDSLPIEPSSITMNESEEEDRILCLPSIPATASPTSSSTSTTTEDPTILPLDQIISSSEFESSELIESSVLNNQRTYAQSAQQILHPRRDAEEVERKSTSSSYSVESFQTATGLSARAPSPTKSGWTDVEGDVGIALHPLSCPMRVGTLREGNREQEDDREDKDGTAKSDTVSSQRETGRVGNGRSAVD